MPTSSIRISENIRRAVQNSDYNLSALAREGIEQAIIGELVGVCWICGEGIHQKERRDWINSEYFADDIADGVIGSHIAEGSNSEHQDLVDYHQNNETNINQDQETYYTWAGKWLNLPDKNQPVEFCSTCSDYIKKIREQEIHPTDIPIPYQFRSSGDEELKRRIVDVQPEPRYSYAAESAAVYLADYNSHQQTVFNTENIDKEIKLFWWAARGRSKRIIGTKYHPWLEIALRSHGQALRRKMPLQGVYKQALQTANRGTNEIKQPWRPGSGGPPPKPSDPVELPDARGSCIACGTDLVNDPFGEQSRTMLEPNHRDIHYCDACLFSYHSCTQQKECEHFHPKVNGKSADQLDIELHCFNCESSEEPPESYKKKFRNKYNPIFNEIASVIPIR